MNCYYQIVLSRLLSMILLTHVVACTSVSDTKSEHTHEFYHDIRAYIGWHRNTFNQTIFLSDFYGGGSNHYQGARSSFKNPCGTSQPVSLETEKICLQTQLLKQQVIAIRELYVPLPTSYYLRLRNPY